MRNPAPPAEVSTAAAARPIESANTMGAIVQESYGTPDQLRYTRTTLPVPADDEVLVRVNAAGVNRGTVHLMTGRPYLMRIMGFGFRTPKNRVPGQDAAGTVVAVGSAVTRFAVGEEVFGIGRGTFAEYAVAREDTLARKPAGTTFPQAAAVGISALTALQALRDVGRVQPGQRVLIIGASGGVGTAAVQLAKALGADVTGVCSPEKLPLVRSLGADRVIDYTSDDFADGTQRYDLILDIGGNPTVTRLRRALTPTGTAVIVGGENGGNVTGMSRQLRALAVSPFVGQRLRLVVCKENAADLEELAGLMESGRFTPSIDRTYPLDRAPEAVRRLESGAVAGKVVITV